MPFVPQVPGVPSLPSYAPPASVTLLVADALALFAGLLGPQWGIFFNGIPVVIADNVVSLEFKQEWSISDYPVEQGAFESYDKVNSPFEARIRFSAGGSAANKQALLASLDAIADTTELFDVVTPEAIYRSVSISHYDYRRTAQSGVGLLQVDVHCFEVRVTTQTEFTNTQSPSGSSPTGGGLVSPTSPTAAESAALPSIQ